MRLAWKVLLGAAIVAGGLFIANTSRGVDPGASQLSLLAHKGLGQTFDLTDIKSDDCTAARMLPPRHAFLENTIASIGEAFRLGANVVELDIQPTTDGQFAVFHDWTLDCRTNGAGVTRAHAMDELRKLDIGYGYTADGGKTFPFRGKGTGLMPTLDEVLAAFPSRTLLINIKSNDAQEGEKLAAYLATLPRRARDRLMVYGGDKPVAVVRQALPELRTMSRGTLQGCLIRYILFGWSGYVPSQCQNSILLVPTNVGPWLWGWPHRFQRRMTELNTVFFAVAPYHGGAFSNGIDGEQDLRRLPKGYVGGLSTDQIDTMIKLLPPRQP